MIPSLGYVRGVNLDPQTRCEHYHGPTDIIAIRMKCCGVYYACEDCHAAMAEHEITLWPENEWDQESILCDACGATLTILQYMQSEFRCPSCGAQFKTACRNHYHLYFDVPQVAEPL
ncbi:MAG: CHY zinc finger protein [Candidatus Sulfotelmatobacter sp.]